MKRRNLGNVFNFKKKTFIIILNYYVILIIPTHQDIGHILRIPVGFQPYLVWSVIYILVRLIPSLTHGRRTMPDGHQSRYLRTKLLISFYK